VIPQLASHARTLTVGLCVTAFLIATRPARAQAPASDEETLIKHGLELRQKGDDEAALRDFRRAYELWHSGRAMAQIALAEQALGHWADAEAHLSEALRHAEEPWVARNMRLLKQSLGDIQSHLGSLQLSGGVASAEVLVNGARVGTLPIATALRVPAGSVALEVRAPNYLPMLRTVIVSAGGLAREPVVLVPLPSSNQAVAPASDGQPAVHVDTPPARETAGVPVAHPRDEWSTRRKVGVTVTSAAVASLALGVLYHLIRNGHAADFNAAGCTYGNGKVGGPVGCPARYDEVQQARNFAIAGYGGAVVLGGVGAYLWITSD